MLLLQQMMVLFIYMIIGYVACKKGIFDDVFSKKMSWLVVDIAEIALVISAAINNDGSIGGERSGDYVCPGSLCICDLF